MEKTLDTLSSVIPNIVENQFHKQEFSLLVLTKISDKLYFAEMDKNKHLTKEQLQAYSAGTVKGEEKHKIGKHLLRCDECLKQMPSPTVEAFWKAIMEDSETPNAE